MANERKTMKALVTEGTGGPEKLVWKEVPLPRPRKGEVLIKVLAAAVNNTDINTRLGWYSSSVEESTEGLSGEKKKKEVKDGGWGRPTPFPMIQGTDCCGQLVDPQDPERVLSDQPVLVRPCMISQTERGYTPWFGSDRDGSFAEYTTVPESEVFEVRSDWTPGELASVPCAWGTAENLIRHGKVTGKDRVLVTGASGGVGSAALQLLKLRGAEVFALSGRKKAEKTAALGARVIPREESVFDHLKEESLSCIIDLVGGKTFPDLLKLLDRGGRYVTSGAIGGPVVSLDLRTLYLKDLVLTGCTRWDPAVFSSLIGYIEAGRVKPMVYQSFPLEKTAAAQEEFLKKEHFGKILLIPPGVDHFF